MTLSPEFKPSLVVEASFAQKERQEMIKCLEPLYQGYDQLLETEGEPLSRKERLRLFIAYYRAILNVRSLNVCLPNEPEPIKVSMFRNPERVLGIKVIPLGQILHLDPDLKESRIEEYDAIKDEWKDRQLNKEDTSRYSELLQTINRQLELGKSK